MRDVKSDQVKQLIDNLEKYHLFTEGKLKLFIHKEFDQCGSLLPQDYAGWRNISFTHATSINSRRKKQPHSVV